MVSSLRILVRALVLAALAVIGVALLGGCGQPGILYLPTEPAAANRATLPQSLIPDIQADPPATTQAPSPAAPAPDSNKP